MRRLPGPHQRYIQIWAHTKDFIRDELEKHKQSWDPSDPRDYIDCFLNEIQVVNDTGHRVALLLCCLVKLLCICFSTYVTIIHDVSLWQQFWLAWCDKYKDQLLSVMASALHDYLGPYLQQSTLLFKERLLKFLVQI